MSSVIRIAQRAELGPTFQDRGAGDPRFEPAWTPRRDAGSVRERRERVGPYLRRVLKGRPQFGPGPDMWLLQRRDSAIQGADIQEGRGINIFGVHHFRHALQGGDDHALFPFIQFPKPFHKVVLQRRGR